MNPTLRRAAPLLAGATLFLGAAAAPAVPADAARDRPDGASAATAAAVSVVKPVITFRAQKTPFRKPFSYAFRASVSKPKVPLRFTVVRNGTGTLYEEQCVVTKNTLQLTKNPSLPTVCLIEASAASVPRGYAKPKPVRALVTVEHASYRISVAPVPTVDWSADADKKVQVRISESSGSAIGITVQAADFSDAPCRVEGVVPSNPNPNAFNTSFTATVALSDPAGTSYTCSMTAKPSPSDPYNDGFSVGFPIKVVP
jgi:hypothetical protein